MLLGKRPRPPIRRTTSMSGITVDFGVVEAPAPSDLQYPMIIDDEDRVGDSIARQQQLLQEREEAVYVAEGPTPTEKGYDPRFLEGMVSPRNHLRRHSCSDQSLETTANFLRICGLCNRRLAPARDIYMYRGDAAFCSLECREKQMKQDTRKTGGCSAPTASTKTRPAKHGGGAPPAAAISKAA